jgi:hypothetical protein
MAKQKEFLSINLCSEVAVMWFKGCILNEAEIRFACSLYSVHLDSIRTDLKQNEDSEFQFYSYIFIRPHMRTLLYKAFLVPTPHLKWLFDFHIIPAFT